MTTIVMVSGIELVLLADMLEKGGAVMNLIKDRECIECVHFLMCKGKPLGTERCIRFEQRENKFIASAEEIRKRNC